MIDATDADAPIEKDRSGVGINSAACWYKIMKAAEQANLATNEATMLSTFPAGKLTNLNDLIMT